MNRPSARALHGFQDCVPRSAVTFLLHVRSLYHLSGLISGGIAAALVMLIVGFFFAPSRDTLWGVIGSSNNPIPD